MKLHLFSCLSCLDLWHAAADAGDWWDPVAVTRRVNDPAALRSFLKRLDDDGDGKVRLHCAGGPVLDDAVEIEDAVAAVAAEDWRSCVEGLLEAFEFFDRDGDGVISAGDLVEALRDVVGAAEEGGGRSWAARCEEMVGVFDRQRIGGVSFDDLVVMLSSSS